VKTFRTYDETKRVPARAMEPVVDPAGWSPGDLDDVESWSYHLTAADSAELIEAAAALRRSGVAPEDVSRQNFRLRAFGDILRDVRRELLDGRGIVMLQEFPTEALDREGQVIAYLGLGSYLGERMSQNMKGHILGHVKDLGGDYADPKTRGYLTRAELRFHSDGCDYVGLLCLRAPKSGGASLVASSVTVYNRMLAQRPDLVKVLTEDFYRSRKGDVNPGQEPWFRQPVFSFNEGYFSATGAGSGIDKALALPGVPPHTPAQKEAIALYRQVAAECAAEIPFRPGDVQFLNNWVTLHSRHAYEDWPEPMRKRHLLRLWLSDTDGRPIPKEQREGRAGRGVLPAGVKLNAPLDVRGIA
jgi:hypothetical protein